jgi:TolB-like protein
MLMARAASGLVSTPQIHSLAVLPLQNLSAEPAQEYFSDGMTDALITDLAQIGSLKVISRTSSMQYKQTYLVRSSRTITGLEGKRRHSIPN